MKGKAYTQPQNLVLWENGYRSNMPDWITARECAVAHEMLIALKECRTVLLHLDTPGILTEPYDVAKFNLALKLAMEVIARATGLEAEVIPIAIPMPPGFAK